MESWDRRAFYDDLVNKYYEKVYNYCRARVKGRAELSDLVENCTQDTFLEALKKLEKLKDHPNVAGWLYKTAGNLVNDSFRGQYDKNRHEISGENILDTLATGNEFERYYYRDVDLEQVSDELLKKLPENEYELCLDYFKKKMSISELSGKYRISTSAITTRIYRVKLKIRSISHAYFDDQPF